MGELFGLQWGDLDFNSRFVEVRRNITRGRVETPKSGQLRRVDMSQQLAGVLKELLRKRKEEYLRKGESLPEWVFINSDGTPLEQNNFRNRIYVGLLANAGLRQVRFHDLRHTFASLLLQQGETPTYVKEQMGHHSIQVTVDIYGHLIPGSNKQAVDRLDNLCAFATA
jgi:integrase